MATTYSLLAKRENVLGRVAHETVTQRINGRVRQGEELKDWIDVDHEGHFLLGIGERRSLGSKGLIACLRVRLVAKGIVRYVRARCGIDVDRQDMHWESGDEEDED